MSVWKHGIDTNSWVLSEKVNRRGWSRCMLPIVGDVSWEEWCGGALDLMVKASICSASLSDGLMRKIGDERATKPIRGRLAVLSLNHELNLIVDGSLLLDPARKTIQDRWRKTVWQGI